MRKGINHIKRTFSLDKDTVETLKKIRTEHFLSESQAVRQAIKEFYEKHNG